MAAKCGAEDIDNNVYIFNEKKNKNKCDDRREEAKSYEYISKNFGFRKISWVIKNGCITPSLKGKITGTPEFYVRGANLTLWQMSLERRYTERNYRVFFHLKRLKCHPFHGNAIVDGILEYTDHSGQTCDQDFHDIIGINANKEIEVKAPGAGLTQISMEHVHEFKLTLEILVDFEDTKETFPLCENLGIRRLCEDLGNLYDNGVETDLTFMLANNKKLYVHKAILHSRITKADFQRNINRNINEIDLQEFVSENVEKVIKFLYTGNLNFTVLPEPSFAVYKFAEYLDVKPILAYYNPDEMTFTSGIDVEEFSVTWAIEDFSSRDVSFLLSPIMTNKTRDIKWQIKVYPKGFRNEGIFDVFLVYEITVPKTVCVEIFLPREPEERISYICHKQINTKGYLKTSNFIELEQVVNNYTQDDSLTIGVNLRMTTSQNNDPVCNESKADYKYLSQQKYYDHLSNDIATVWERKTLYDMDREFHHLNYKLETHASILLARCEYLYDSVENHPNRFESIRLIEDIMHFVYSGKLHERILLDNIFALYEVAESFGFLHLKVIIEGELRKILTATNARRIRTFAHDQGIADLEAIAFLFIQNNINN